MRSTFLFVLVVSVSLSAQAPGVRDVTASSRSLIKLQTQLRYTSMIILPDGEDILDVVCGDRDFWVISATANIAHVKPAKEGAMTNLNLITASGAIYSFLLNESGKIQPDLKVYVTAEAGTGPTTGKPKYYPATALKEMEEAVTAAQTAQATAERAAADRVAMATAAIPTTVQFPYEPLPYRKPFWIRSMWRAGDLTYIRTDAKELPVLYELKDGKPAIVNFQTPKPDTYVIPKQLEDGYFQLGKERLEFRMVK